MTALSFASTLKFGKEISGYADLCRFSCVETPIVPTSITVNKTGMQTEQIFGVSIRENKLLFSVAAASCD